MVNSLVERATSEMLMGPDWAMNIEICDILNRDLSQSKDVVKGIKKRIKSKNAKVQLFALILLETIIKNCGEIIHLHIAEKEVLNEMVKIVKKKPEVHVKEKILSLIDIWQEAFGGPRARYPQFYAAYQDLLRMGAVFPQKSDRTVPVFTPPQTQPLASHPQNFCNPDSGQEAIESSTEAEFPTLSLSEIQNARGIMDVLAEMLNALDPGNKEVVKQEVIVNLVEQCRTYKQRVVHLVNSTSDESLLCQGLALNDDLQRLLAKHEAIVSGAPVETEKPKSESPRALVDVDSLLIDTGDSKRPDQGSNSDAGAGTKLLPPAPIHNSQTTPPAKTDNQIDLLSGDSFSSPKAENSLALVPVKPAQPSDPVSQENALALVDMFAQSNNTQSASIAGQTYYLPRQFQQQDSFQSPQVPLHQNGSVSNMIPPQYEQSPYAQAPNPAWNNQMPLQQHSPSLAYGAESSGSLPPPPWEAQLDDSQFGSSQSPQPVQVSQVGVSHFQPLSNSTYTQLSQAVGHDQPCMNSLPVQGAQFLGGMLSQTIQPGQMAYMYAQQMYGNGMGGYGYGYGQQNAPSLEQGMSGLSMRDNGVLKNSSFQLSTASFVPYSKPSKPEDKLFGDLVDITKFKGTKATPARAGSM